VNAVCLIHNIYILSFPDLFFCHLIVLENTTVTREDTSCLHRHWYLEWEIRTPGLWCLLVSCSSAQLDVPKVCPCVLESERFPRSHCSDACNFPFSCVPSLKLGASAQCTSIWESWC